jgi:NAD(P)-dependent dehydrogenase (short-subunit alcohol dehydrogenase family)
MTSRVAIGRPTVCVVGRHDATVIDLSGRVVLVTGAAGGIGSAVARAVAGAGGSAVLHDVEPGRLHELATELGSRATALAADLAAPRAAQELWDRALEWRGRLDVLVNNAGIYEAAEVDGSLDAWTASWERTLAVNLVSPATLCRAAVRTFREQDGGGIIVNLASRAAFRGEDPDYWHYAASKAGVVAMTRTLARQYGREGVTAFAVAPGFVDTAFNRPAVERHGLDLFAQDTGLGEVARPEDVANVVVFLASGLARHATGTTIDVNGASYVH